MLERTHRSCRLHVGTWLLVVAVAGLDLVSKAQAQATLRPLPASGHRAWLRFGLVINRGATFGVGANHPWAVVGLSAVALLLLAAWLTVAVGRVRRLGLALILGGGLGNLVDRFAHGAVTDWIHVSFYPATFNLADVAIRAGLSILLVELLVAGLRRGTRSCGGRRCDGMSASSQVAAWSRSGSRP